MTDVPLIGPASAPELSVMSFNIRRRFPRPLSWGGDRWAARSPLVGRLLAAERPAVVGVQEAFADQTDLVVHGLGPQYRAVGWGRNADGGGEGCPIVYDAGRLELLDWRQLALSSTPQVAGSRSFGNPMPRVVVVARLRDRVTGTSLRVVNTHLDPFSARSRLLGARLIADLMSRGSDTPTVLTCDANAPTGSPAYRELTGRGGLADAWHAADQLVTPEWNTYSGYRAPRANGRRIDWLLVSGGVRVLRAGVNATRFDGRAASDHEPVQALLRLPAIAV
jgi:endonuclease/exonuclease/phosphatase family metal-dependent hydrolase